jgi:hypothetical protein
MPAPLNSIPSLSGTGPPPSSLRSTNGFTYKGHGDPNGQVSGYEGDEYIDLDTGAEWHKLEDNAGKQSVTGWSTEGLSTPTSNSSRLLEWAMGEAYQLSNQVYDADGLLETATVRWPDNSSGVYTMTEKNTTWLREDAYTITHASSSKTVTQPARTRDEFGRVVVEPNLTVS